MQSEFSFHSSRLPHPPMRLRPLRLAAAMLGLAATAWSLGGCSSTAGSGESASAPATPEPAGSGRRAGDIDSTLPSNESNLEGVAVGGQNLRFGVDERVAAGEDQSGRWYRGEAADSVETASAVADAPGPGSAGIPLESAAAPQRQPSQGPPPATPAPDPRRDSAGSPIELRRSNGLDSAPADAFSGAADAKGQAVAPSGGLGGGGLGAPAARARASKTRETEAAEQANQVPVIRGPFDEIWVIVRDQQQVAVVPDDGEIPGVGSLCCPVPNAPSIPMPLQSTDYRVAIRGPIAESTCTQRFLNTFTEPVEAVYVFPLPHRAAVADFVLTVGERRIRGIVRDRVEAEQIYRDAQQAGFTASLLREDRPNVFTEKIANLAPQVPVDIELTWFEALGYDAGWHELALPLVVAPRWNACGASDAVLPAAAPIANAVANAAGNDATVVPYLPAGDDGINRVTISVDLDAGTGVAVGAIESPTHAITVERSWDLLQSVPGQPLTNLAPNRATVALAEESSVPNRDFVLRWQVAGETPRASIVASRDADGSANGHLLLTLYPPEHVAELPRPALDLAVLLDRSGSMNGQPLAAAQQAVEAILASLAPNDRVLLGSFSNDVVFAEPLLASASPERIARLKAWTGQVQAGGGTNLLSGLDSMLFGARELEDAGRRQALVILTDGLSGDEGRIIKLAHDKRGVQEIHCLGIGDSTNRFLIDELARAGDGTSGILLLGTSVDEQVRPVIGAVQTAAIVNPSIDFAAAGMVDAVPNRLPTLRPGRPIVIAARWEGEGARELVLAGTVGTTAVEVPIRFDPPSAEAGEADRRALSKVWARATIAEMSEVGRRGEVLANGETALEGIRRVALEHGLVSPLTSFVAVDASEALAQPGTQTIRQAVPVPHGIDPATTIPGGSNSLPAAPTPKGPGGA